MRKILCIFFLLHFLASVSFAQKDTLNLEERIRTHLQLLEAKSNQLKTSGSQVTSATARSTYNGIDGGIIGFRIGTNPADFRLSVTVTAGTVPPKIENIEWGKDDCVNQYIYNSSYYLWQKSIDNGVTWTGITSYYGVTYQPPALTQTTLYRRSVLSLDYPWGCPLTVSYSNYSVVVNVVPALSGGTISTSNTTVTANSSATLNNTTSAIGGIAPISYQWQQKNAVGTFVDISNATTEAYTTPALQVLTTYRRKVTDANNNIAYSNEITITVFNVDVNGGTIGFYSGSPTQYSATPPLSYYLYTITVISGTVPPLISNFNWAYDFCLQQQISSGYDWGHHGPAELFYSWEKSTDEGATWTTVVTYGGTYQPPLITQNTLYRRLVHTAAEQDEGCGTKWGKSNTIYIQVTNPPQSLVGGTIATNNTNICPNSSTAFINANAASGGTAPLTYQWEEKNTGGSFTNILNANAAVYTTPALSAATSYRRKVTDANNNIAYSNEVTISPMIPTPLRAGIIDAVQVTCTGTSPGIIENIINACGGLGSLQYTWETSNAGSWTTITNSDAPTYNAAAISTVTKYRRKVSDACGNTAYSNEVETLVYPTLEAGTVTPITQTVCSNTQIPEAIGLMQNCHYTNDYSVSYQWQIASSPNGPWTDINSSTQAAYQAGLTSTATYYRLKVSSTVCNAVAYSNVATIDVKLCTVTSNSGSRTASNLSTNTNIQVFPKQVTQGETILVTIDNITANAANYKAVLQSTYDKMYVCTITSTNSANNKIQLQIKLPVAVTKGNYTIQVLNNQKIWSDKIVVY